MVGVAIGLLDGFGGAIVATDVAHELVGQVPDRGEDPRAITSRSILANQFLTWLSQEE
jgi:hypothetical protein